ncbi:hypothetical protein CLU85_0457 [Acidovorax sp. 69]|uniref:hypothetical protein n=1 Tax=Acidovorax sp. 69 TaxID=2035202 RepID=UPI000C25119E|nr:hypothetical protein [Acidovorax sp. 69]PJI95732.1 hypothetical protein CLU85_0457 [Acidovorax sp. 69]
MTMDTPAPRSSLQATDYSAFLQQKLATQPHSVMSHVLGNEQIWVKRAGVPHGTGRYRAMAMLAGLLRLDVLRPVPNPGGPAAIATEVRRLQDLAARGVRVPEVLAVQADGFAMRHLGRVGEEAHSLGNAIDRTLRANDPAAVLLLWQQGLDAMTHVHHQGTCLSQAFARNMVRDPTGAVVCIDFEDDPAAVLPLALCHVRDALCYAHSTAIYLHQTEMLPEARERWAAWVAQGSAEMQAVLATSIRRMRWMRHLPPSRRLGRDLQRVRAAYDLLSQ